MHKKCKYCSKQYSGHLNSKYCSKKCADKANIKGFFRKCGYCGKSFWVYPSRNKKAKYCSLECLHNSNITRKKRRCKYCGKQFLARASSVKAGLGKYCSNQCSYASKKTQIKRKCKICGKEFWAKLSRIKKGLSIYCSQKCSNNDIVLVKRKCIRCGKIFEVHPSDLKYYACNYCSNKCRRYKQKVECYSCGKTIWLKPSRIKKAEIIFCSIPCRAKYYQGAKSPSWIDGRSNSPYSHEFKSKIRKSIRVIDNNICQICKKNFDTSLLPVHHIDFNKSNNRNDNLITYCSWCHGKLHGKARPNIVRAILSLGHKKLKQMGFYAIFRKAHKGEKASIMAKLVKIYKRYPVKKGGGQNV